MSEISGDQIVYNEHDDVDIGMLPPVNDEAMSSPTGVLRGLTQSDYEQVQKMWMEDSDTLEEIRKSVDNDPFIALAVEMVEEYGFGDPERERGAIVLAQEAMKYYREQHDGVNNFESLPPGPPIEQPRHGEFVVSDWVSITPVSPEEISLN